MHSQANHRYLKSKRWLAALVFGLAAYILPLANQSELPLLSPERRILLSIIAFRLLMMVQSGITTDERERINARNKWHYLDKIESKVVSFVKL